MSNLWMPGAKVIKGADSGAMLGGPAKVIWHTTESDPAKTTAAGVAKYLQGSGNTVHLVWNPITGEIVQMIPANLGGKGLENRPGGVQTNRGGTYVIQVEVVGRASQPFTNGPMVGLPKIQAWLISLGIPPVWAGTPDRSVANWAKAGHFGHADVPENAHWDPGKVDKAKLTGHPPPHAAPPATQGPAKPAPNYDPEEDMDRLIVALYRKLLGRTPADVEVDGWLVQAAQNGWTGKQLATVFAGTGEAKAYAKAHPAGK